MYWLLILLLAPTFLVYDWWHRRPWVDGIHKKAVLVTGCDTGFGRTLAKSLYARGVHVYAGCYTESGAESLRQETGERLRAFIVDVSQTESIKKALEYVNETLPEGVAFWGLVNNAGIFGYPGPAEFITSEDCMQVFRINVCGMMEMSNAFMPLLKKYRGRIVNMVSAAGEHPVPGMIPYCVSKHAARVFSEIIRIEKEMWGISVSTILPAFYRTNITDKELYTKLFHSKWEQLDPSIRQEYGEDYVDLSIEQLMGFVDKTAEPELTPVIRVYEHALFSIYPRKLYYPGVHAKLLAHVPAFILNLVSPPYFVKPKALRERI